MINHFDTCTINITISPLHSERTYETKKVLSPLEFQEVHSNTDVIRLCLNDMIYELIISLQSVEVKV